MGRLSPVWDSVRSYLGIVALLVLVLPAAVLLLTLLAENSRPMSTKASSTEGGEAEVANRQARLELGGRGGSGEEGVHSLARRNEDGSPERGLEGEGAGPTRQIGREEGGTAPAQGPPSTATNTPAASTATAGASTPTEPVGSQTVLPAPTAEPASVSVEAPPDSSSQPATTVAAPASASAPAPVEQTPVTAAPEIVSPMLAPGEVPGDSISGAVSGDPLLDSFE